MTTPALTKTMISVASALMSGDTPSLTLEKMYIGSVLLPGPDTKLAMTRSSRDSVNASSQPATIAGAISGRVTSNTTRNGLPPRSNPDGSDARFDVLRPQRLAAPVTVYVEQFSAHPLEADAAELYGPPDGYLDGSGQFRNARQDAGDRPVYRIDERLPRLVAPLVGPARNGRVAGIAGRRPVVARSILFRPMTRTFSSHRPTRCRLLSELNQ